jgi:ribosome maturation factor RimP
MSAPGTSQQQIEEARDMAKSSNRDQLIALLGPVVTGHGLDLEDVEVTPAGRRRVLRVVVDGDGGVGLDTVAEVSTAVSATLDSTDAMGGTPYVLEVSSPGVDRPLLQPRHWRRAAGRLVEVTLTDGSNVTGRVLAADEAGADLDEEGTPRRLGWAEVARGRVQVEFRRKAGAEQDKQTEEAPWTST